MADSTATISGADAHAFAEWFADFTAGRSAEEVAEIRAFAERAFPPRPAACPFTRISAELVALLERADGADDDARADLCDIILDTEEAALNQIPRSPAGALLLLDIIAGAWETPPNRDHQVELITYERRMRRAFEGLRHFLATTFSVSLPQRLVGYYRCAKAVDPRLGEPSPAAAEATPGRTVRLADLEAGGRLVIKAGAYGFEANTLVEIENTPRGLGFCNADKHMREHHPDAIAPRWYILAEIAEASGIVPGVLRYEGPKQEPREASSPTAADADAEIFALAERYFSDPGDAARETACALAEIPARTLEGLREKARILAQEDRLLIEGALCVGSSFLDAIAADLVRENRDPILSTLTTPR